MISIVANVNYYWFIRSIYLIPSPIEIQLINKANVSIVSDSVIQQIITINTNINKLIMLILK